MIQASQTYALIVEKGGRDYNQVLEEVKRTVVLTNAADSRMGNGCILKG